MLQNEMLNLRGLQSFRLLSYFVSIVNLFSCLAALVIGAWFISSSDRDEILAVTNSSVLKRCAHYLIVFSVIYSLCSFLYMVGVLNGNTILYSVANVVVIILSTLFVALLFVHLSLVNDYTEDLLMESLQKSFTSVTADDKHSKIWNLVQVKFGCCGSSGSSDWLNSLWHMSGESNLTVYGNTFKADFPISCCFHENLDQWRSISDLDLAACYAPSPSNHAATRGCYEPMKSFIKDNIFLFLGYLIYIICLLIVGQILSLTFSNINWEERR